jgi:hypothetical protein
LNKWQSRDEVAALIKPESPNMSLPHESNVSPVDNNQSLRDVVISDDLSEQEFKQVRSLLEEYAIEPISLNTKSTRETLHPFVVHHIRYHKNLRTKLIKK